MLEQKQIERARSINLLSYLQTNEPANLKQVARNSYCLLDHDSLKISENGKWYWFSQGFGSNNALDYLIKVRGMGFENAVAILTDAANRHQSIQYCPTLDPKFSAPSAKQGFLLPTRNKDNLRAIAYLQSRGIDRELIAHAIENGILYESAKTHNCVFVGRDTTGKSRYAFMRGTMGNFKQEVSGSDKQFGFCLTTESPDRSAVAVFESAVDALSMATLSKISGNPGVTYNLSLGGTSPLALDRFLTDHPDIHRVILCLDNDAIGRNASNRFKANLLEQGYEVHTPQLKNHKDWNDALMSALSQHHQNIRPEAAQSI